MGETLFTEFEAVLARDALFANSRLNAQERSALLDSYLALCEWTRVYFLWRTNLQDESDDHLIELAVAGDANVIVTWSVLTIHSYQSRQLGRVVFAHWLQHDAGEPLRTKPGRIKRRVRVHCRSA